jgi:hypothetical protein
LELKREERGGGGTSGRLAPIHAPLDLAQLHALTEVDHSAHQYDYNGDFNEQLNKRLSW